MSEQSRGFQWFWEISILVLVAGILAAIAIPNWGAGSHRTSPANACINNLRQIDAAANQFALEHSLTNGDRISFPNDLTPYIKLNSAGKIPPCPSGGVYHISKVGETPTCSLGTTVTPGHVLP
jgi:type II secretory pathway pseudopilin PulG